MAIPFPPTEIGRRQQAVARTLTERGLDALLCLRPESRYWLAGDDPGDGFECLLIDADANAVLLTREPEVARVAASPQVGELRHWRYGEAAAPWSALRALLDARALDGARLGVEYAGLASHHVRQFESALAGLPPREDASELVGRHRALKSPSEMACIRRAAGLADDALDAALALAGPGAWEGAIHADMQGAVLRGGGDCASREFRLAGADGAAGRGGRRHLASPDSLVLEWAGVYRRYHAAMARTVTVGEIQPQHRALQAVAADAMAACLDACAPGATGGGIFDAQARVIDAAGLRVRRSGTCGHGVGATFAPTGAEWPLLESGSEVEIVPGMALLLRVIIHDPEVNALVALGQTVEVSEAGAVPLHRHGTELLGAQGANG